MSSRTGTSSTFGSIFESIRTSFLLKMQTCSAQSYIGRRITSGIKPDATYPVGLAAQASGPSRVEASVWHASSMADESMRKATEFEITASGHWTAN